MMTVLGWIFVVLLAVAILFGIVALVASIDDIRRYRRIRRM